MIGIKYKVNGENVNIKHTPVCWTMNQSMKESSANPLNWIVHGILQQQNTTKNSVW